MTQSVVPHVPDHIRPLRKHSRLIRMMFVATLAMCTSGCVHRRMTIRTNPPGAAVYVDDYPIGTSPVSTSFTYYGTRKIRIVKDGYQTLTVERKISAPWYQYFPLDFVSENLVPNEIRDERVLDFALAPQMIVPTDQLIGRAETMRQTGRAGAVIPASAEVPLAPPPFGSPTPALPLPGQPAPPQYGTQPIPGVQPFGPGIQPLPPTGQPMLPPPGTQPVPVPGPTLNPFARPTVPPPTPGPSPLNPSSLNPSPLNPPPSGTFP